MEPGSCVCACDAGRVPAPSAFLAALTDPAVLLRRTMPQSRLVRARLAGQAWRRLPAHHVCFVLRAESALILPDGRHALAPGCLLWLPPGQPHCLDACADRTLYRLRFRLERDGAPVPLPGGPWLRPEAWSMLPLASLIATILSILERRAAVSGAIETPVRPGTL